MAFLASYGGYTMDGGDNTGTSAVYKKHFNVTLSNKGTQGAVNSAANVYYVEFSGRVGETGVLTPIVTLVLAGGDSYTIPLHGITPGRTSVSVAKLSGPDPADQTAIKCRVTYC